MYIIVGLGNPGAKYDGTRHNIGFEVLDQLARKLGVSVNKIKYKALIGEGMIGKEKVILMKPQTYMNISGESVMGIVDYYNLPMENLIVIYDDIDTDMGKVRIRKKGSAGTHNGMRSIIYLLKKDDFPRIRMGVGGPPGKMQLADYVLGRFRKEEFEPMERAVDMAVDAVIMSVQEDVDKAMNTFNGK